MTRKNYKLVVACDVHVFYFILVHSKKNVTQRNEVFYI